MRRPARTRFLRLAAVAPPAPADTTVNVTVNAGQSLAPIPATGIARAPATANTAS